MKSTSSIISSLASGLVLACLSMVMLTGSSVRAQGSDKDVMSQELQLDTRMAVRHSIESQSGLSSKQVARIAAAGVDQSKNLSDVALTGKTLASAATNAAGQLAATGTGVFTAPLGSAKSVLSQHRMSAKVVYDAQPIGGILTIKVEVIPAFSGVGIPNRPVASRSMAQAVDGLDRNQVAQVISDLSSQLEFDLATSVN